MHVDRGVGYTILLLLVCVLLAVLSYDLGRQEAEREYPEVQHGR